MDPVAIAIFMVGASACSLITHIRYRSTARTEPERLWRSCV